MTTYHIVPISSYDPGVPPIAFSIEKIISLHFSFIGRSTQIDKYGPVFSSRCRVLKLNFNAEIMRNDVQNHNVFTPKQKKATTLTSGMGVLFLSLGVGEVLALAFLVHFFVVLGLGLMRRGIIGVDESRSMAESSIAMLCWGSGISGDIKIGVGVESRASSIVGLGIMARLLGDCGECDVADRHEDDNFYLLDQSEELVEMENSLDEYHLGFELAW
ncbi:NGN domain-containing protein [Striga asiatica]|uniref:NGN domain-containing protein n=1 Tax=Striga asiatica TaxID=4170 RepID=A0A5A7PJ67_STRAF|nr:NGN domain-containing protein [Striga asiatica]